MPDTQSIAQTGEERKPGIIPRGTVLVIRKHDLFFRYLRPSGRCHYLKSLQTGHTVCLTDAELSGRLGSGYLTVERYEPQEAAR